MGGGWGAAVAEDVIRAGNRILGGWVEDVGKRLNGGKQPLSWPDTVSPMSFTSHLTKNRRKEVQPGPQKHRGREG